MAGRLVKNGEPGRREVCPGQRDELALSCGQCRWAQVRVVSAQPRHHVAQANSVDRGIERRQRGIRRQVAKVLAERASKDIRLLGDQDPVSRQVRGRYLGQRHATEPNLAG